MASKSLNAKAGRVSPTNVVHLIGGTGQRATPPVDIETVRTLEALLARARAGDVNGLAFIATTPGMRYISDAVGFCYEHPTFARGAVSYLGDQLAGVVHRRDPDGIR